MTLSDLSAIGSFISGIGVLVSLVYLGFQIRQNTLSHRATANQNWLQFIREESRDGADPATIALRMRVDAGDDTLTDAELQRYFAREVSWFVGNAHLVWLHENKILDDGQYQGGDIVLRGKLRDPATRATWDIYKQLASPALRKVVESHLANLEPGSLSGGDSTHSLIGQWREAWKTARAAAR